MTDHSRLQVFKFVLSVVNDDENESHETIPCITRDMDRFVLVPMFSYAVTGAHVTEGSDNSESQDEL